MQIYINSVRISILLDIMYMEFPLSKKDFGNRPKECGDEGYILDVQIWHVQYFSFRSSVYRNISFLFCRSVVRCKELVFNYYYRPKNANLCLCKVKLKYM